MRIYGYTTEFSMRVENPKTGNISIISDYCSANFPVKNCKPQNNLYKPPNLFLASKVKTLK